MYSSKRVRGNDIQRSRIRSMIPLDASRKVKRRVVGRIQQLKVVDRDSSVEDSIL